MIKIYEKLSKYYTDKELKEKLGEAAARRLRVGEFLKLETIASRIEIKDYTYEDFIEDYGEKYKNYKEKRNLYSFLLKAPKSMRQLSIENGLLDTSIVNYFLKGFTDKVEGFNVILPYLWDTEELRKDIKTLDYKIFDDHVEIYGEKDRLEKFKEKYSIPYKIIFHSKLEIWHLAFDGRIEKIIKYINKKEKKCF